MELMDLNQMDDQADKTSDGTLSPDVVFSDVSDDGEDSIFGITLIHARVGNEYQAQIPQQSEHLTSPAHDSLDPFVVGLPIPVTWVHCRQKNTSVDVQNDKIGNDRSSNEKGPYSDHFLVIDLPLDAWSEFEIECFTLGLYIFGKNLVQVKRFVETKEIGQIQSFYYGRFYKTPEYCKWSDCKKMRNKKCTIGSKIFTGCHQQELLSRILPLLKSEQSKAALQEVSNSFSEGRISLEEYVSEIKSMIGIAALVEAVGVGKGKGRDLTTLILKSSRKQRANHPDVPSGKAYSSLSSAEIVDFLTGDFRLSKARSNDLFWEAVWPCLLAKGWHSEQPKHEIFTGSKNSLVFLIPGVKKFSSRRLVKGHHYFDCVSDVLRKVASDPKLLQMGPEDEACVGKRSNEENGSNLLQTSSDDDYHNKNSTRGNSSRSLCYLKPQGVSHVLKFTVVDTSIDRGGDIPFMLRQLKSLPPKRPKNLIRGLKTKQVTLKFSMPASSKENSSSLPPLPDGDIGKQRRQQENGKCLEPTNCLIEHQKDDDQVMSMKQQLISCEQSGRGKIKITGPAIMQSVQTSCNSGCNEETFSSALILPTKKEKPADDSLSADSRVEHGRDTISASNSKASLKNEPMEEYDSSVKVSCVRLLMDLNELPQGHMEEDMSDHYEQKNVVDETTTMPLESCSDTAAVGVSPRKEEDHGISEDVTTLVTNEVGSRRHSTRNRPLTTKALEALEFGFLNLKQRDRKRKNNSREQSSCKPSRRRRKSQHDDEDDTERRSTGSLDGDQDSVIISMSCPN